MSLPPLYYAKPRGQCAVMLLAALRELYVNDGLGSVPKRKAIEFISEKHWFSLRDEDYQPYPSQDQTTGEPRWHTLIAWARKDSVLRDLVSGDDWNAWGITRAGRDAFEDHHRQCVQGIQPVAPCYLWSHDFKRFMAPQYLPGASDAQRPQHFYRDIAPIPEKYRDAAQAIISNGTWLEFTQKYREATGNECGAWVPRPNERDVDRLARMIGEYLWAKIVL